MSNVFKSAYLDYHDGRLWKTLGHPKPKGYREQIAWLQQPGNLEARLHDMDGASCPNRIFVMGCGRSGTWLQTAVMSTFRNVEVIARELCVEHFGLIWSKASTLVLKRDSESYFQIERIPERIGVAYIVRHPYDVLTSQNPNNQRNYHIHPHRWLGEMLALQYLIDTNRTNTKIIRYEDLVAGPEHVQAELKSSFRLEIATSVAEVAQTFKASRDAVSAMHGVRPIDRNSVARYRSRPDHIDHLKAIRVRLGRTLDWVSDVFGYDISL